MASVFANYKAKRIERILSAPPSTILSLPWVKRALSIIAVVSSYLALAGLLLAPFVADRNHYASDYFGFILVASYLPWVMLIAFVLLRRSTRRITSLPDEYLDEREIANRDWAFRMGYVVIRRVGLAISTLVIIGFAIQYIYSYLNFSWTGPRNPSLIDQLLLWVNSYLVKAFAVAPVYLVFGYVLLLTYVAYSFPVILLAWREARLGIVIEQPSEASQIWKQELARLAKGYRVRVLWVLAVIVFYLTVGVFTYITTVLLHLPGIMLLFNLTTLLLIPWALYSVYVYFWALIAQLKIVRLLGLPGIPQKASLARASHSVILAFTAVLGIAVPISMYVAAVVPSYGSSFPLGYAFIAGFALIALQIASFVKAQRLAKSV